MLKRPKRYSLAIERNLLACYYRANANDLQESLNWYQTAHDICKRIADSHAVTLEQACGVLAALSPGRNWELNVQDTEVFIGAWQAGLRGDYLPKVGTYGRRNVIKSIKILKGDNPLDVLGGSKVRSFYANIIDPTNHMPVTIDRHAKCAACGLKSSDNSLVRESEYGYLVTQYRTVASKVGLRPNQLQAVIWTCWRRLNGVLNQMEFDTEVPF